MPKKLKASLANTALPTTGLYDNRTSIYATCMALQIPFDKLGTEFSKQEFSYCTHCSVIAMNLLE